MYSKGGMKQTINGHNYTPAHSTSYRRALPVPTTCRVFVRIVTNSSAAVGWMPTVASNCALVAPHLSAMPRPCMISAASGPTLAAGTQGTPA